MSVMTVFCHGTKSYSDEKLMGPEGDPHGELVWVLEKNYVLPRELQGDSLNGGKYLLQGVGSKVEPTAQRLTPQAGGLGSSSKKHLLPGLVNQMVGNGIGHNVRQFIALLDYARQQNQLPTKINMVGWSRGGVTCVRLAQKLHEGDYQQIPVNIFAADPVPGAGRHQGTSGLLTRSKGYDITPNVDWYVQTMAMHEAGNFFRPLEPKLSRSPNTSAMVLPMPGNHGDVVYAGESGSGRLALDLAIRFLRARGSAGVEVAALTGRQLSLTAIDQEYAGLRLAMTGGGSELAQSAGLHPMKGTTKILGMSVPSPFKGAHGLYHSRDRAIGRHAEQGTVFMNKHEQYVYERLHHVNQNERTLMQERGIYPPSLDPAAQLMLRGMYGA